MWDWLHGTLRLDVPQEAITIGVAAWCDPDEVRLPQVLEMPLRTQRDPWRLPDDRPSYHRSEHLHDPERSLR